LLTSGIESARAPGARTGSAKRPGRKSGAGRPTVGRWCLLEAPANSGERAGGRSASTSPPAPSRSSPVVPFACHIQGSIPVPSGQPRSHLGHRRAGRPRRTSKNASRECAEVENPRRAASGPGGGLGQATWAGSKVTLGPAFELAHQPVPVCLAVLTLQEVVSSQVGVRLVAGEQVPGDHQDGVGHRDDRFVVPTSALDPSVVGAWGARSRSWP
jgi:hypothetical protein